MQNQWKHKEDGSLHETIRQGSKENQNWYDSDTWRELGELFYIPNAEEFSNDSHVSGTSNLIASWISEKN